MPLGLAYPDALDMVIATGFFSNGSKIGKSLTLYKHIILVRSEMMLEAQVLGSLSAETIAARKVLMNSELSTQDSPILT